MLYEEGNRNKQYWYMYNRINQLIEKERMTTKQKAILF